MKITFLFICFGILTFFICRSIWRHFISPSNLSKLAWYKKYKVVLEKIKSCNDFSTVLKIKVELHSFISSAPKEEEESAQFATCIDHLHREIAKKYFQYSPKPSNKIYGNITNQKAKRIAGI